LSAWSEHATNFRDTGRWVVDVVEDLNDHHSVERAICEWQLVAGSFNNVPAQLRLSERLLSHLEPERLEAITSEPLQAVAASAANIEHAGTPLQPLHQLSLSVRDGAARTFRVP
jgi:hypothetical protein